MRRSILRSALPVAALVLFAVPARFEGPVLVPISPGHGLSAVDVAAVVLLLAALAALGASLVRRRARLACVVRQRPGTAAAVLVGAGFGAGLLFASVFPFFWWWAVGAALLTLMVGLVALASAGRVGGHRLRGRGAGD